MFVYCPKCGFIEKAARTTPCPVCSNERHIVPEKYLSKSGNLFLTQDARITFINEVIKTSPVYDQSLADRRNEIQQKQLQERDQTIARKVAEYNSTKPVHKCPVCGSTNLSAISTVGKVAKISLLGVWGAGDLGKKSRCNSCGHKF